MDAENLKNLSQMYAFVGNSLLKPYNQTKGPGLDPAFWAALPDFGDAAVGAALDALCAFAAAAQERVAAGEDAATEVSYEHTRLFVGPPAPAAAPWETYYPEAPDGAEVPEPTSGFGEPTFRMRALLREAGLELSNENHQFEDHIGIELLYLSVLYGRAAEGGADASADAGADSAARAAAREEALAKAAEFIEAHPGRWIGRLAAKVEAEFPDGYVIRLLRLAQALLAEGAMIA